jgi:hypothetical protein
MPLMHSAMPPMPCLAAADALRDLARRLDRLSPDRRDPHAYFEAKSDLVGELRRLAADLTPSRRPLVRPTVGEGPTATSIPRPRSTASAGTPPARNGGSPAPSGPLQASPERPRVETASGCLLERLVDAGMLAPPVKLRSASGRGRRESDGMRRRPSLRLRRPGRSSCGFEG